MIIKNFVGHDKGGYVKIVLMISASLTLAAARDALAARQITSLELTESYLQRIAQFDSRLNAFITVTAESAREQAQRADEERARGVRRGSLHGIPIALKDLYDVRGVPTTAGSKILRDNIAAQDAEVVTRLRAAGAVLLGKNNMHEFAYGVTNENPHHGDAHNPWNPERITGGSSGGGAAAVAAGFCLGTLGTDTGGSIRIPAALCGISGLKPTFGRVSLRGVIPLSWSNDHAGPLAQTAQDCAMMLEIIAGYDPRDPGSVNAPVTGYHAALNDSLRGMRFAAPHEYFDENVSEEIMRAVREAERVFQDLGADCVNKSLSCAQEMFQTNRVTLRVDAMTYHREWLQARPGDYSADVLSRLKSAEHITAEDYAFARRRQVELRRELELFFDDIDFFITPTTRVAAPLIGSNAVELAQHLTAFTAPFDVTGLPAISIPCGSTSDNLPIGLQIVGRPWDEACVLQVAHQFQLATGWHLQRPPLA